MWSTIIFYGAVILLIALLLVVSGIGGPRSLRDRMRKLTTRYYKDASLFFPIDPYKPLPEALREGWKNFLPTKERVRNWERLTSIELSVLGISVIFALVFSLVAIFWASK